LLFSRTVAKNQHAMVESHSPKKGEGMTGSEVRFKNGIEYKFQDLSSLLGKQAAKSSKKVTHKPDLLRNLQEQKQHLLKKIETWQRCPKVYRRQLYRRLYNIELSKKDAGAHLDEMRRELEMLAFNLQLNPQWVRGLLKLIDEILDQTESDQRQRLTKELRMMQEALGTLKHGCNVYQIQL